MESALPGGGAGKLKVVQRSSRIQKDAQRCTLPSIGVFHSGQTVFRRINL
ncbi:MULTISPECIES: hypothetical protein [unclassified Mesorhizobium]|nr:MULTISPECIES: hypothetical protein [unclassified Mesorhizobium]